MEITSLKKLFSQKAIIVCSDIQLSQSALDLLSKDMTSVDFLKVLMSESFHIDAIRFLARGLPKREATWWAYICVCHSLGHDVAKNNPALEAAKNWVYNPSELNRLQANKAAQSANFDQPPAWVAISAFWSSGSIAPEGSPVVPPAENLTGKAVAGAILLSAVLFNPEKSKEKYLFFLQQGIDIANGGNGAIS